MAYKKALYINADPAISPFVWLNGVGASNLWIAAMINEPSHAAPNMKLVFYRGQQPRFVTTRPIKAGEELTARYGSFYIRTYKVFSQVRKE